MAANLLIDGPPPPLPGPEFPPHDAPAAVHLEWCVAFGAYCESQIRLAREFNLPVSKWTRAAELAALAASIWRQRAGS